MDTSRIHAVVTEFVRDLHPANTVDVVTSASFEELDAQLATILTFGDLVDFAGREVGR